MDVYDTRLQRLRRLIDEHGGKRALAKKLGQFSDNYLTQLAGPSPARKISEKFARRIEQSLGLPRGWLDGFEGTAEPPALYVVPHSDVAETITAVLSRLQARGLALSPAQVAALTTLVYNYSADPEFLDQLVDLIEIVRTR